MSTENAKLLREETYNFGDIAALKNLFADAKNLRRGRQPQYVMVVEDDPLTSRLVSNVFKENYAMLIARDAQEAIANYLAYAPDIVFLDIGLPDANGFTVLKQINVIDKDAFVVMFSGNNTPENIATALKEGAAGFIAKPFIKETLRYYLHISAAHHHKSGGLYSC